MVRKYWGSRVFVGLHVSCAALNNASRHWDSDGVPRAERGIVDLFDCLRLCHDASYSARLAWRCGGARWKGIHYNGKHYAENAMHCARITRRTAVFLDMLPWQEESLETHRKYPCIRFACASTIRPQSSIEILQTLSPSIYSLFLTSLLPRFSPPPPPPPYIAYLSRSQLQPGSTAHMDGGGHIWRKSHSSLAFRRSPAHARGACRPAHVIFTCARYFWARRCTPTHTCLCAHAHTCTNMHTRTS